MKCGVCWEGTYEWDCLDEVAFWMTEYSGKHNLYKVEDCWMDYGAGIKWTTIICYMETKDGYDDGFQALYPVDWEKITSFDPETHEGLEGLRMFAIHKLNDLGKFDFCNSNGN